MIRFKLIEKCAMPKGAEYSQHFVHVVTEESQPSAITLQRATYQTLLDGSMLPKRFRPLVVVFKADLSLPWASKGQHVELALRACARTHLSPASRGGHPCKSTVSRSLERTCSSLDTARRSHLASRHSLERRIYAARANGSHQVEAPGLAPRICVKVQIRRRGQTSASSASLC